jgi:hypothetical protein
MHSLSEFAEQVSEACPPHELFQHLLPQFSKPTLQISDNALRSLSNSRVVTLSVCSTSRARSDAEETVGACSARFAVVRSISSKFFG